MKNRKFLAVFCAILLVLLLAASFTACKKIEGSFMLNFYSNGEKYHSFNIVGEETIQLPQDPTRDGYEFDGWYFDDGIWNRPLTVNSFLDEKIKGNIDVFAKWVSVDEKETYYKVSFNSMKGSEVARKSVKNGDLISEPASPTRDGYIFAGWYKEADYTTKWNFAVDTIKSDITLYAKWATETDLNGVDLIKTEGVKVTGSGLSVKVSNATTDYNVFEHIEANPFSTMKVYKDKQGKNEVVLGNIELDVGDNTVYLKVTSGSGTVNKIYTLKIRRREIYEVTFVYDNGTENYVTSAEEDGNISFVSAGVRPGFEFKYWTIGGRKWNFETDTIKGDTTLTAEWESVKYAVAFNSRGGNSISPDYFEFGKSFSAKVPKKADYDFVGWETSDGSLLTYESGEGKSVWNIASNTTLYAKWKLHEYSITYENIFDATNANPSNYTIESGEITFETLTDATGRRFVKWQDESGADITKVDPSALKRDITITAVWELIDYRITYVLGDGAYAEGESNRETYTLADEFDLVFPQSNKQGYEFDGWYTAIDGGAKVNRIEKGTSDDKTFYARYKLIEYTITYTNEKTAQNLNARTYTIESESIKLSDLSKINGYTFVGWNMDGTKVTEIAKGSTGNKTITAVWTIDDFDIKYENLQGTAHSNLLKYNIETLTIRFSAPDERTGYTFDGWYDSATGGNKVTEIAQGSYGDKVLYARWNAEEYDIEYIGLYNIYNSNPTKYTIETATVTLVNPGTRNGYEFVEWQRADSTVITEIPKGTTGKLEIRAIWRLLNYSITYENTGSGTHDNITSYTYESETILLNDLSVSEGYTFDGWYDSATGGNKVTEIAQGSYGDKVLYARVEANKYTVSLDGSVALSYTVKFNGNGASIAIPAQTVTETNALAYPAVPERSGYIFGGWYVNAGCTGAAYDFTDTVYKDMELYAKWIGTSNETIGTIEVNGNKTIVLNGTTIYSYDFVPLVSGNVTIYTTGNADTYGYLYKNGSQIVSNDDSGEGYNFRISYNVTAGEKYTIKARGYGSSTYGSATLRVVGTRLPADGGLSEKNSNIKQVTYDGDYNLGVPTARPGFKFLGWYTDINCGGTKLTDGTGASIAKWNTPSDLSVYSGFEAVKYKVTFVTNLGSSLDSVELAYGERLDLNGYVTKRERFSFAGWYLDVNDESPYEATTMPANDLTLNAKWTPYSLSDLKYDKSKKAISINDAITADLFEAVLIDSDGDEIAISAVINGEQTAGSTVQVRLSAMGKYDTKKQVTISDIKVYGMPTLNYDTSKNYFSLSDDLNASLWGASGADSYGVATEIKVSVVEGDYRGGDIVSVLIESVDIAGNVTSATVSGVKVYDKPVITYDNEKSAIKDTDTIGNELWSVSAQDNFGVSLATTVSIIQGTKAAGNTITVRISSTDGKGNVKNIDMSVKVYGKPVINVAKKTDFKVSDEITVASLGLTATDSHNGNVENVAIEIASGTKTAGTKMVYNITATDIVGNVQTSTVTVKIYDAPSVVTSKTFIKDIDDVTRVSTFGVTATDSFGNGLTVSHAIKSGVQTSGSTMAYSFTATDKAGNTTTVEFGYKVYSADGITLTYFKGASNLIKLSGNGEEFGFSATDSFGDAITNLQVIAASGIKKGGETISIKLRATDVAGNCKDSEIIENIKVYDIPTAVYKNSAMYIKEGQNIDFLFTVKDSFGEELVATVETISDTAEFLTVKVTAKDTADNLFESEYKLLKIAANQSYLELYVAGAKYGHKVVTQGENFILPRETKISDYTCWKIGNETITNNAGASLAVWNKTDDFYRVDASGELTEYSVTYELNGGACTPVTSYIYGIGATLPTPTKTGYTFDGWFESAELSGEAVTEITATDTGAKTYYAKWTANKYTVTFNSNGGTTIPNAEVTYNENYGVLPVPTKTGYTFAGWFDNAECTGEKILDNQPYPVPNDITLHAKWNLIKYSVTYVLDGGINDPENPSVYTIEDFGTIPLKAPVRITKKETGDYLGGGLFAQTITSYTFLGWYKDSGFTEQVTEITLSSGAVTLYAKWTASTSTTTAAYKRINANGTENASGEYILFGEYPQTKVTDEAVISALGDYANNEWTSYGYYRNKEISNFMEYTDKEFNGAKYRGVYFTSYRPFYGADSGSAEDSEQDDNGYNLSTVYWFKYEPIKWRILSEEGGKALILCDIAIDSQAYDYKGSEGYKNNYAESTIRTWLNETFYNTAFSDMQKTLIQTTEVDNGVKSTGYKNNQFACENTNDKVFLLSYADVTNDAYGFNSDRTVHDEERQKKSTDYAKSQGCYATTNTVYEGNCVWWLRSPFIDLDSIARYVDYYGFVFDYNHVYSSNYGVFPALTISLS